MRPVNVKLTAKNIYNPPRAIMFIDGSQSIEQALELIVAGLYGTPDPTITLCGELDGSPRWMGFADYHFDGTLDIDITGWVFDDLMKFRNLELVLIGPTNWRFSMRLSHGEPPASFEIPMVAAASGKVIPSLPSSLVDAANRAADGMSIDPSLCRPLANFAESVEWKPFFLPFCNQYMKQVLALRAAGKPAAWVRFAEEIADKDVNKCAPMLAAYLQREVKFLRVGADGQLTPTALKMLLEYDLRTTGVFKGQVEHMRLPRIKHYPKLQKAIDVMLRADLLIQAPAGICLTDRALELLKAAEQGNYLPLAFLGPLTEIAIEDNSESLLKDEFPVVPRTKLQGDFHTFVEERLSDFPDFSEVTERPFRRRQELDDAPRTQQVRFPGERVARASTSRVEHLHLRMVLKGVKPLVSRVIRVPAHLSVEEGVPDLLKLFGWGAEQAWRVTYVQDKHSYTIAPSEEGVHDSQYVAPADVQLAQVFAPKFRVSLGYDSRAGWEMEVVNTGSDFGPHSIKVLKAKHACPPEGCDGPRGYQQLRDIRRQGASYLQQHPNTPREWFAKERQLAESMQDPQQPQYPAGYQL